MERTFNIPRNLDNFRAYVNSFERWEAPSGETLTLAELIVTKNTFPFLRGIPISEIETYHDLSRARWNVTTSRTNDAFGTIDAYGVGEYETKVKYIDGYVSYLYPPERKEIGQAFSELIKLLVDGLLDISKGNKELEQKFGILLSPSQEQKDFDLWKIDAKEFKYQIGVLFIDIDNFKKLNSNYTEIVIDKTILTESQLLLKQLARERGEAYRHGGDEFVVILPNHNLTESSGFAEKLRIAFQDKRFIVNGNEEKITVSVGVALWPHDGNDFLDVLSAANEAENQAKKGGRNKVIGGKLQTHNPRMHS
jgi:diguanylate cyclase (GGDEF)-like protein